MLKQGDKAPAAHGIAYDGRTFDLGAPGRRTVLFFYPKASTPGCTVQSCNVRDARRDFAKKGVAVIGVSPDKPSAQKKFDEKNGLAFPLLADTEHAMAEAYGVWGEKSMYGRAYFGIVRSSFLVDEKGKIAQAWYKVSPEETVPLALKAIKKD